MKVFLDQVYSDDRKFNRRLKKILKGEISLRALDQLGYSTFFYLKNTGRNPENVNFDLRVVFEQNDYLPVMGLKISGYSLKDAYRLSTACFIAIEEKLNRDFMFKTEHEQKVVQEDIKEVFDCFIEAGYLLKDNHYLLFSKVAKKANYKKQLKMASKEERKVIKHYANLRWVEEVIQDVV